MQEPESSELSHEEESSLSSSWLPAPRHSHSAVVWESGEQLCVFGGCDKDSRALDDLLLYHFGRAEWVQVKKAKRAPSGRHSHTAVVWRDSMFVFGGVTTSGKPTDQLLQFDFHKETWSEVKFKGKGPRARWGHSAVVCHATDRMWIFGGMTKKSVNDELFCFHLQTKMWEQVQAAGSIPPSRYLHSAVTSPRNDYMIIVGGSTGLQDWRITYEAREPENRHWEQLEPLKSRPGGIRGHKAVMVGDKLIVHGGRDQTLAFPDLRILHFADGGLEDERELTCGSDMKQDTILTRYYHSLIPHMDRIWVYGGLTTDCAVDAKNSTEKLHLLSDLCEINEDEWNDNSSDTLSSHHRIDFIAALPAELSLLVMSFVPLSTIGSTLPLVCHKWRTFVEDDELWRKTAMNYMSEGSQPNTEYSAMGNTWKLRCKEIIEIKDPFHDTYSDHSDKSKKAGDLPVINIMVMGGGGVGKSALTIMFTQGHFVEEYDPTLDNNYPKCCQINDVPVVLDILEFTGCDDNTWVLAPQYYAKSSAFMMVYSVNSPSSLEDVYDYKWCSILRAKEDNPFSAVLVGNKCDVDLDGVRDCTYCERLVSLDEGLALARRMSDDINRPVPFIETSAKLNINVTTAFAGLARMELRRRQNLLPSVITRKTKPGKCTMC